MVITNPFRISDHHLNILKNSYTIILAHYIIKVNSTKKALLKAFSALFNTLPCLDNMLNQTVRIPPLVVIPCHDLN